MNKKLIYDEIWRFTPKKKNILSGLKQIQRKNKPITVSITHNFGWRVFTYFVLILSLVLTYIVRAYYLQIVNRSKFAELAENNKTRNTIILAERGVIYSSEGVLLARNKPSFAIELNKSQCKDLCTKVVSRLQQYVTLDPQKVQDAVDTDLASHILAVNLDRDTALLLEANLFQMPGISVVVFPERDYHDPFVYAHSLGYVGLDDKSMEPKVIGKSGIEQFYDEYLQGIPGRKITVVDSTGTKYDTTAVQDALPGRDVEVYLHNALSGKAYELLKKKVDDKKATAGVVVAQDPFTGGVLALVSYPSFDSNKMSGGISATEYSKLLADPSNPFFNRAISAVYPPGSTFKMITAAGALSEGVVTKNTTIHDQGYVIVNGFRFNNWKLEGHGEVNIVRALQVSNDTYFYTVGGGYGSVKGLGIENLNKWARRFGMSLPTGIDMPTEESGFMPNGANGEWYLGNTYITSIGQGDVLSTPLQVNTMTGYFANGGKIMKPQIVKSIKGVKTFEPKVIAEDFIDQENFKIIQEGLHAAVSPGGTGYPLFDFPQRHGGIQLGGKTGTSEYINKEGKPATHAWFTVYGPYVTDNAPTKGMDKPIVLTVFLEGGGAGSDDAAPIAKELLDLWFK
jgi:penicillin-binding protein 2